MKKIVLTLTLLACSQAFGYEWMLKIGKSVEGEFVKISGTNVVIKNDKGKTAAIPMHHLEQEDQEHAKGLAELAALKKGSEPAAKPDTKTPSPKKKASSSWKRRVSKLGFSSCGTMQKLKSLIKMSGRIRPWYWPENGQPERTEPFTWIVEDVIAASWWPDPYVFDIYDEKNISAVVNCWIASVLPSRIDRKRLMYWHRRKTISGKRTSWPMKRYRHCLMHGRSVPGRKKGWKQPRNDGPRSKSECARS